MQVIANEALQKFPSDSSFKLYNGFSYLFQKQISEALRILDPLRVIVNISQKWIYIIF